MDNRTHDSIKKRLQLLRWVRPITPLNPRPPTPTRGVFESVESRAETLGIALTIEPTAPVSPIREATPSLPSGGGGDDRDDRSPTGSTNTEGSQATIYTAKGSSDSEESSSGVEWLSPVLLPLPQCPPPPLRLGCLSPYSTPSKSSTTSTIPGSSGSSTSL
ncbi:hypothetical protein P879_12072, partial [Paragonimus westermani]